MVEEKVVQSKDVTRLVGELALELAVAEARLYGEGRKDALLSAQRMTVVGLYDALRVLADIGGSQSVQDSEDQILLAVGPMGKAHKDWAHIMNVHPDPVVKHQAVLQYGLIERVWEHVALDCGLPQTVYRKLAVWRDDVREGNGTR